MTKKCVELPYGLSKPQQSSEDRRSEKDQHRDGNYIDSITQGESTGEGSGGTPKMHTFKEWAGGKEKTKTTTITAPGGMRQERLKKPGKIRPERKVSFQEGSVLSVSVSEMNETMISIKKSLATLTGEGSVGHGVSQAAGAAKR